MSRHAETKASAKKADDKNMTGIERGSISSRAELFYAIGSL
jgi:hypothetical protein